MTTSAFGIDHGDISKGWASKVAGKAKAFGRAKKATTNNWVDPPKPRGGPSRPNTEVAAGSPSRPGKTPAKKPLPKQNSNYNPSKAPPKAWYPKKKKIARNEY